MKERKTTGLAGTKQFLVACCFVVILAACLLGIYLSGNIRKESGDSQLAEQDSSQEIQETDQSELAAQEPEEIDEQEEPQIQSVTRVVQPEETEPMEQETVIETDVETDADTEPAAEPAETQTVSVGGAALVASTSQSFSGELAWPVEGSVLMNYSMDQSVYFATLDQYKRNPALIIGAGEGTAVAAAAAGTITEISTDAQTGQTVCMDIGDGYTLIYGQLQDLKYNEGAHLDAGDVMGSVAAATKYYALEGNNLYFAMEKDGVPVDPTEYLPQ